MGVMDELLGLERAGWDALCDGTGADFYGSILTDDAVMVLANGLVMDRAQVVASLVDSPPWGRYELTDERLIPIGGDAATLTYTGRAWRGTVTPPFVAVMSSVYVRADDEWRLAVYQQTPVPPAA